MSSMVCLDCGHVHKCGSNSFPVPMPTYPITSPGWTFPSTTTPTSTHSTFNYQAPTFTGTPVKEPEYDEVTRDC